MNTQNWQSFQSWKDYSKQNSESDKPIRVDPITDDTIFLWSRVTAPLPMAFEASMWEWFPEPKALVGYLRFILFPESFQTLLDFKKADHEPETIITAEDLFAKVEQGKKSEYAEDISLMREIITRLDTLFELPSDQVADELKDIAQEFNCHFGSALTVELEIDVFNSPTEVGEEIINRKESSLEENILENYDLPVLADFSDDDSDDNYEEWQEETEKAVNKIQGTEEYKNEQLAEVKNLQVTKSELLQICENASTGKEAQRKFIKLLDETPGEVRF